MTQNGFRVTQVYDVAHGNTPEFISGNFYNYHEVKHEKAKIPKSPVKVLSLEKMERAKATKESRRAARQATRLEARQSFALEVALKCAEQRKPKAAKNVPYHKSAAAGLVFDLVTA